MRETFARWTISIAFFAASAIFGCLGNAFASVIEASSADDVCAPSDDPCIITDTIVSTGTTILDFGHRAVEVRQGGRFDVGDGDLFIRCRSFDSSNATGAIVRGGEQNSGGGVFSVSAEATCTESEDVCTEDTDCDVGVCDRQSCDGDLSLACSTDASCQLGSCSAYSCSRDSGRACTQDGECSFGSCNLSIRRCAGDVSRPCFNDTQCNLGHCDFESPRCTGSSTRTCVDDSDCNLGNCSTTVCSGDHSKICTDDAQCFFGTCDSEDNDILLGGRVNTSASAAGAVLLSAAGDIVVSDSIRASSTDANGDGGFIELTSGDGSISIEAPLVVRGGRLSAGGDVCALAADDVLVDGKIDLQGGDFDGGILSIEAGGDVFLNQPVKADARSGAGVGGEVDVVAGGDILIFRGVKISTNGHTDADGFAGDGGTQEYQSDGMIVVGRRAQLRSIGPRPNGYGDEISLKASGDIVVHGRLASTGRGSLSSKGGDVVIETIATGNVILGHRSVLDSSGSNAGEVEVSSVDSIIADGKIRARGSRSGYPGGVSLSAINNVTISGRVQMSSAPSSPQFSEFEVRSKNFLLSGGGRVRQRGADSHVNQIMAACQATFERGSRLQTDGTNELILGPSAPSPIVEGVIIPELILSSESLLDDCSGP